MTKEFCIVAQALPEDVSDDIDPIEKKYLDYESKL
jgi:hypothetical protein